MEKIAIKPMVMVLGRCAAFFLIGLLFSSYGVSAEGDDYGPERMADYASKDMALVPLGVIARSGKIEYRIPKAYLGDSRQWGGGVFRQIVIEAGLPDMKPWSVYSDVVLEQSRSVDSISMPLRQVYNKKFFNGWVSVRLSYGNCFKVSNGQLRAIESYGAPDTSYRSSIFTRRYIMPGPSEAQRFAYVGKKSGRISSYVKCSAEEGLLSRCDAESDYDEFIHYEMTFSSSRLAEFEEIDAKVRRLLAGFLFQTPKSGVCDS